jgi:hypothetical protein
MSNEVKRQYLERVRLRYLKGTKKQKTLILDEFCEICEISRKHAIKLLGEEIKSKALRPGAKVRYGENIKQHIVTLWQAMNRMCSKKMVAAIPIWLDFYLGITPEETLLLKKISSSSIDRILAKHREEIRKGKSGTVASLIKNKIPLKLLDHDVNEPGYLEADTVVHCGNSLAGEFTNSLTMTDLFSSWTENRAIWKKESETVMKAIKSIEESLPFDVKGFASDNVMSSLIMTCIVTSLIARIELSL